MKTLYFVVEKELRNVGDDILESTGWKIITVYEIEENKPKKFFSVEAYLSDVSIDSIQNYLDDNGFGDDVFEFVQL